MPTYVHERAPAKVNLLLRIVGRRADGYHQLVTILSTLELADELVARRLSHGPPGLLRVTVQGPQARRLEATGTPLVEEVFLGDAGAAASPNLVVRAAAALACRVGRPRAAGAAVGTASGAAPTFTGVPSALPPTELVLIKRIPAASGLGGGSSDAAAALRALARLWAVECSQEELQALGASLGADVPFFVRGGVQLAEGIGERLTPLDSRCQGWYVLAVPEAVISTRDAYRVWDSQPGGLEAGRRAPAAQAAAPQDEGPLGQPQHREPERAHALREARAMVQALARGDLGEVAARLHNDLERAAVRLCPSLADVLAALRRSGLFGACVSGSGPAAFGLARSAEQAQQALRWLERWRDSQPFGLELFVGRLSPTAPGG